MTDAEQITLEQIAQEFHTDIGYCLDDRDRKDSARFAQNKMIARLGWSEGRAATKAHDWYLIDRKQRFGH